MNREEFIRIRTDALVSFHTNPNFNPTLYLKACEEFYADGKAIEKQDSALMAIMPMIEKPPYRMQDLDKPSIMSNLNLPDGYDDYVYPTNLHHYISKLDDKDILHLKKVRNIIYREVA